MRPVILSAALLAAAGCADEFDPPSLLQDVRVLAVEASPTEVGPLEPVKLTPTVWSPAGDPVVAHGWRFCPLTRGPAAGYECLFPQCETKLESAADGSVEADPSLLILACLAASTGGTGPTPAQTESIPERVETVFRYRASTASGLHEDVVVRVPLWTRAAPTARNQPPIVQSVELDGLPLGGDPVTVRPGAQATLRVRVDPASLEAFTDESGRERQEEAVVSFFADAGSFEFDREQGTDVRVRWTLDSVPDGLAQVTLYAVARDLRGGQGVAGPFKIDVAR